jgi:pimeloyl-ACP methyl ester carboxylesterase
MGPAGTAHRVIELTDGRAFEYAEWGDPDGYPVVWHHGGLSSALDAAAAADTAAATGVRLIAPNRPGVGRSDRMPGRTLLDWPTDLRQLLDRIRIERFGVAGWSLGGAFAMAAAARLPDRVGGLVLVASVIPRDWEGMNDEINATDRRFMWLTRVAPPVARAGFAALRTAARRTPRAFTRRATRTMSPAARARLDHPPAWFASAVVEGLRNTGGVVDEYRIFDAPWGFDPGDLTVPVHVFQGADDRLVPLSWGTRLAARVPGSVLTEVPAEGHFLAVGRFDAILGAARRGSGTSGSV